jgi:anti-sigma factor ChrR (cupin superfamily)
MDYTDFCAKEEADVAGEYFGDADLIAATAKGGTEWFPLMHVAVDVVGCQSVCQSGLAQKICCLGYNDNHPVDNQHSHKCFEHILSPFAGKVVSLSRHRMHVRQLSL